MRGYRLSAAVLSCGLAVGAVVAQPRVFTKPVVPPPDALDRLNLHLAWKVSVPMDGVRDGIASIQNIGGQVIVQTARGRIACLDEATGAVRWMTTAGQPYSVTHEVGFNDDLVLVANATRIYALDRANGSIHWDVDLPGTPSSPPAADKLAFYVNLSNGRVATYLLPEAAAQLAQVRTGAKAGIAAAESRILARIAALPTADPRPAGGATRAAGRTVTVSGAVDTVNATVAVQATGGRTAASGVDIKKAFAPVAGGKSPFLLWDFQTTRRIQERPVVGSQSVLVVATSGVAIILNRIDGGRTTELTTEGPISAPVGQYGEMAYVADRNGGIYAVDLERRVFLWQYTANSTVTTMPQATDYDLYVVADRGGLIRMDRELGTMIWQNPEAAHYLAINPKFVYATDGVGRLIVLDRRRGTRVGRLDLSGFVFPVQNETTDRVLLGAHDGTVICLHDKSYPQPLSVQSEGAKVATPAIEPEKPEPKPEKPLPGKAPEKPASPPSAPAKPETPKGL